MPVECEALLSMPLWRFRFYFGMLRAAGAGWAGSVSRALESPLVVPVCWLDLMFSLKIGPA